MAKQTGQPSLAELARRTKLKTTARAKKVNTKRGKLHATSDFKPGHPRTKTRHKKIETSTETSGLGTGEDGTFAEQDLAEEIESARGGRLTDTSLPRARTITRLKGLPSNLRSGVRDLAEWKRKRQALGK